MRSPMRAIPIVSWSLALALAVTLAGPDLGDSG
jgi:hypothetical protein